MCIRDRTTHCPLKNGEYSLIHISGRITKQTIGGCPVCYAFQTDISDIVMEREKQKALFEDKSHCFEWMMDEYMGNIYICDMESYELLYLNRAAYKALQEITHLTPSEILGHKCYEVIQGRTSPCPFCTNDQMCIRDSYRAVYYHL